MNLWRIPLLVALLACASIPVAAASRHTDLEHWVTNELTPFVTEQLASHPRFKGEPLHFVVLQNGNPQALSNSLALRLRDQLRDAAADVPGVRIAWQPGNPQHLRKAGPGGIDCTKGEVHYLIGIEMSLVHSGQLAVEVRALDVEDRTAVAGFSRSWSGPISSNQYREFRRAETDLTFRGEREVPYQDSQTDLLAAHLAHDLGCNLLRQMEGEYVISESRDGAQPDPVSSMVELVSNNLAQYSTLQFTTNNDSANAVIEGKAHRIDKDLYQYWVTVHAKDAESELQALSVSAYVRLPEQFFIAERYADPPGPELRSNAAFLTSLKIVELRNSSACRATNVSSQSPAFGRSYGGGNFDCFALQVQVSDDAVIFFLNHQLNNGLVRLGAASCTQRSSARVARIGQHLQFTLPPDSLPSAAWTAAADWQLQPDLDTYSALAATDTLAARALSQHIERLPRRCSSSVRPGFQGLELQRWMKQLTDIVNRWEPAIDWQTIRVKNIY